jgi:hypothetical protein
VLLILGTLFCLILFNENFLFDSFCFKQDGPIIAPLLLNNAEVDVIDLTPFLCYKSKQ